MKNGSYFNRDLSWLSFNDRVLAEAGNETLPLYERIKFLAIYSSNLDEFFRVRVAFIKRLMLLDKGKLNKKAELSNPGDILAQVHEEVGRQQNRFGRILQGSILPLLRKNKIHLYHNEPYQDAHLEAVEGLFFSDILTFIQPIILPRKSRKRLFLENRQLYLVAELKKRDVEYIGIINIPSNHVQRFQQLPKIQGVSYFTFIDDVIRYYVRVIFAGFTVKKVHSVKLNRDAELFLEDDYSENVVNKIKKSLEKRDVGMPSRFLYDPSINSSTLEFLQKKIDLLNEDCIAGGRYHNLFDLFSLPNPSGGKLEYKPMPPLSCSAFEKQESIFSAINKRDILLSFPYQRYDYILRFFNEAAIDPDVVSIMATLYRVARESHITNALISAARNGKNVSVLVEAKARFDEENNLRWAERMQLAGVRIVFSEEAIKVHSKVALVIRKEEKRKRRKYAFLGTGNFNERTADVYTDFALLTADEALTDELEDVLRFTLREKDKVDLKYLLVAQINMPQEFVRLIDQEIENAVNGKKAEIILKLNNLQDKNMIKKLYSAAKKGVQIRLIIRGICCLIPRKNIIVTRIVDRFLEHARIYLFHNDGEKKLFIGSADWMERNLYRRIEVVFPVFDELARKIILDNLTLQIKDNTKAVRLDANLRNVEIQKAEKPIRSQFDFYNYLRKNHLFQ